MASNREAISTSLATAQASRPLEETQRIMVVQALRAKAAELLEDASGWRRDAEAASLSVSAQRERLARYMERRATEHLDLAELIEDSDEVLTVTPREDA